MRISKSSIPGREDWNDTILSTLVTDRRVIDAEAEEIGKTEKVDVRSFFLSDYRIVGVQYEQEINRPWYAWILELFGFSAKSDVRISVGIKSSAESKTFEFDEEGEEIAQAIVRLAAENQA